jgi:hypothetical protein
MLGLLIGREPDTGGVSMRLIGMILLVIVLVTFVSTIRSSVRLSGWVHEAASLSVRPRAADRSVC